MLTRASLMVHVFGPNSTVCAQAGREVGQKHSNDSRAEWLHPSFLMDDRILEKSLRKIKPPRNSTDRADIINHPHVHQLAAAISAFESSARCTIDD